MTMIDFDWIIVGAIIALAIRRGAPLMLKSVRWFTKRPPRDPTGWTIVIGLFFLATSLLLVLCKLHV